jgi:hypothetical protein
VSSNRAIVSELGVRLDSRWQGNQHRQHRQSGEGPGNLAANRRVAHAIYNRDATLRHRTMSPRILDT